MTAPVAGAHYPRSTGEFLSWFGTDDDCLDYLERLRWPGGFVCPDCGHAGGWRLGDGRVKCGGCGSRTSVTAGTILRQDAHTADGVVPRLLAVRDRQGRHFPPSTCSGCWRSAPIRRRGQCCTGFGQRWCGRAVTGCPARSRSMRPTSAARSPVCGAGGSAARRSSPGSPWRFASRRASAAAGWRRSMTPAVTRWVRSSPRTSSQGRRSSLTVGCLPGHQRQGISAPAHQPESGPAAGQDRDSLLPGVHRVASLCKRWLLGTHQGSVDAAHLPAYLNEFVFRFNRRRSASRGMVFYPGPAVSRRPRAGPVRGSARQQKATPCEASRGRHGTPSEPRAPSGGPPVADRRNPAAASSPVKWIPRCPLW